MDVLQRAPGRQPIDIRMREEIKNTLERLPEVQRKVLGVLLEELKHLMVFRDLGKANGLTDA